MDLELLFTQFESTVSTYVFLQTQHVFQPVLLQNSGKIGLGNVNLEGTVAEYYRGVARGFELVVPLGNAEGEQFDVFPSYPLVETGDQHTCAGGTNRFVNDGLGLDGERTGPRRA